MTEQARKITKVLIANRGEIAVRVIRAARDENITSVAVYAEPDADAPFVRMADEAFALGGQTSAESYLDMDKIIHAATSTGADAVHPGYGFLSENAEFAQAVTDAGLIWIGPSPESIRLLGDKVTARNIAKKVNAPMAPGTEDPVSTAEDVVAFAEEHGLPVAIKASFGGGGRGMKVAYTMEEIPDLFESATREAITAFGRGECFVERYLDKARHVEAQILADKHGNIVVGSTRDCSLQRRFQKLVEEAPAPFLSEEQNARIYESAKAICREAGYYGAGTVEYLVASDGLISFLEVNTRLQVEHPVTEQVTGLDLVREQFRIAEGEALRLTDDPEIRGHAIEFRINGEDAANNFMPAPGRITTYREPAGPGVRVDSGIEEGALIGGQFDSMLAKLIVTGATREEAIRRSLRALSEFDVEGLPTVIPFHQAILQDPAFAAEDGTYKVYTRWIEEEWDNQLEAADDVSEEDSADASALPPELIVVEVNGKRVEVKVPGELVAGQGGVQRAVRRRSASGSIAITGDTVAAPMQGTVIKVDVEEGQTVAEGDILLVLEAMKMENAVKAHKSGVVTNLSVTAGTGVTKNFAMLEILSD
ncbi:acetyl/propionyl/methylcrotonyl-CoA carboxylase subunit alpha [Corynebacterium sp. 320]|uniref:acetyl/propionyl/methylcrotonyl-CoA carboxylase subunit alpha n=1 Tax=Corynebacterium TaxID=1716 RepID=UPI00125CA8D7|nr:MULTISPECIES: acetyl/propionyl/methylcrotonyl-CoA carboxylase subunit alpha [Corynebacterium]KAB1504202.1 acetyl/propionyl/methylcrotonyl-CoA carboxylase subunit alpha [Corynebacterium sp. 320]KAB1552698.1 acetyl/propionyl/methylcrotonyl-CoA carboxylase subunit alpha [Corynebacterium sp. 321]KAB1554084.1 acetyl/propionyl/methylcrotonyl-CoA carboxylase subunit alpha [Corynebacterium sp. 319]KAB3528338.1 acetyl/propionyl/methylcrotonyl-CoA carboxylase subunit alpha [Corynebacterium sp. 250]KA